MATGKISRLPREIREQLNRRLDDGEPGKVLVAWLNQLPAVQTLLAAEFGGAAIKEQNLTNWKQGGLREWRMQQDAQALVQSPDGAAVPVVGTKQLSTLLMVRHLAMLREWQESPMPPKRRQRQLQPCGMTCTCCAGRNNRKNGESLTESGSTMAFLRLQAWREAKENMAELNPIKVNQGGKNSKMSWRKTRRGVVRSIVGTSHPHPEEWQSREEMTWNVLEFMKAAPRFPGILPKRGDSGQKNPTGQDSIGVNPGKSDQIKVNQGGKIKVDG